MRAVTYLRFSSKEQADSFSIDAQRHAAHTFIQQRGWTLVQDYVDEAYSAKADVERPAFQQLLADAQHSYFDVVVVDKVDRFYRHLKGLLTALDQLNQASVAFVSVKENLDFSSPWGKIALTILGILAEVYIDNLRQETRKGRLARARNGKWNGSIPFGYCRGTCSSCTDPNGPDYCPYAGGADRGPGNRLIPHPIESIAVQQAFAWYATGDFSDGDIAQRLNAEPCKILEGLTIPYRTKGKPGEQPGPISRDAVRTLLIRRFYTGVVPYYGVNEDGRKRRRGDVVTWYPGEHPPIVDEDLFEQVQQLRQQVKTRYRKSDGSNPIVAHPLSGLLVCASCGKRLRATTTVEGYRYYRDSTRIERSGECNQPLLKAEEIESQVVDLFLEWQHQLPADWQAQLEAQWALERPEAAQEAQAAQERIGRAAELYLAGLITQERLREQQLAYHLAMVGLRPERYSDIITAGQTLEKFNVLWPELSFTKQNELLRLALEVALVSGKSLTGIQLSVAFLPIWAICRCGSDGT